MSKQTWASVVSKPMYIFHPPAPSLSPNQGPESPPELLPTEVTVPEPPPPSSRAGESPILPNSNIFQNELTKIQQSKQTLEADIEMKKEKFHSSYAFTRYNQDMDALYRQKAILDEREAKTKQMLLLTNGAHSKRILEVVKRIKNYLGVQEEYIMRYTTFDNEIRIVCDIHEGSFLDFFSTNENGLEWQITESIEKEYYWPNKIHIQFTVQSPEMIPILEAAIKTELGNCITVNK
jgi:hypothetical protein